jgi:hypothetical protein
MADIVTVTKLGGLYGGTDEDTQIQISSDNIISVVNDPDEDNLENSIITRIDDSKIFAKETAVDINKIVNS